MGERAVVVNEATELLASTTETATGTGTSELDLRGGSLAGLAFTLDLTQAASTGADTLNVYVQTRVDGTNWLDVVAFAQCLGSGAAKRHTEKNIRRANQGGVEAADVMTAGTIRNLFGDRFRVRWAIVDDSGSASFTFSVVATPQ